MANLFDPIQFGDIALKNRVVMAPLTRNRSPKAVPNNLTSPITSSVPMQASSSPKARPSPSRARAMPMCRAFTCPKRSTAGRR